MSTEITKVFILAGGQGTRLSEHTSVTPKPLVPIGPDPIVLWIMRHFYRAGIRDIYLLTGYKSMEFKRFFRDYMLEGRDVTFGRHGFQVRDSDNLEDWNVHIIETGEDATTGQRVNAIRNHVTPGEPFFLTYGDSISDVSLESLEDLHFSQPQGNVLTITATPVSERFGILKTNGNNLVEKFAEKSTAENQYINGGFMACNYSLLSEVSETTGDLSFETLTRLADEKKMSYYTHDGFWHAMDTKRDVDKLNELYHSNPELFMGS